MPEKKVVLVTGVAGYLGARLAARLAGLPGLQVIGLDLKPPKEPVRNLDFIQADVRNNLLPELFKGEDIAAVCHMAFQESDRPNENGLDFNVMGTIRVMGACAEAGVPRVVVPSSTLVYGARPDNSAFLTEDFPLRGSLRFGTVRDLIEIESFCNGFRRQYPETELTVLRFASVVGLGVRSPMTRFLSDPLAPVLLGFDPMMQVIHEEDVVDALAHALFADASGVFNVAAEGVMPLTQLMALAGKTPIPVLHWGVYWGSGLLRSVGVGTARYLPFDPDYLRYGWVTDTDRMRCALNFAPHYTAAETLREFASLKRLARYLSEHTACAYDEERLRDTIERRRQARSRAEQASGAEPGSASDSAGRAAGRSYDDPALLQDYEVDANEQ
jgi:UDP-glucose 4-epimerase